MRANLKMPMAKPKPTELRISAGMRVVLVKCETNLSQVGDLPAFELLLPKL